VCHTVATSTASLKIRRRVPLLHHDRDFDPLERHLGLEVMR
jgi:hypothetical protein